MQLSLGGTAGGAPVGEAPGGRSWLRTLGDRALASDPGLVRLISAGRAVLAIATALGLEYLLARVLGQPPLIGLMLGAVLAMLAAFAVLDPTRAGQAVTMCCLPLFLLAGMAVALAVDRNRTVSLAAFVVVVFAAVFIRRFGPRYFACGMVGFMGYFFALFLSLRPEQLPALLPSVVLATVWVLVLTLVLVPVRNDRVLRRMLGSFEARLGAAADAAAGLAESAPGTPERRAAQDRLRGKLVRLNETALTIDGQLGTPGAVLDDERARTVRRAVFDGELAAVALVQNVGGLTDEVHRRPAAGLVDAVRRRDWDGLRVAAERLAGGATTPTPVRRIAADALVLADVRAEWTDVCTRPSEQDAARDGTPEPAEFAPAVQLFAGNLPGSAPTVSRLHEPAASDRGPRLSRRLRLSRSPRLSLTTRQAVQAAVATAAAVAVGDALSAQRYYWAVLAAFIAFTGTATVAETVSKSVNRVVGTMIGLLAAIPLVPLFGVSVPVVMPVILVSIFGAFYLFRVSYALMIFFITLMLGELYALLGSFTVDLMLLRLEETAAGGLIGCLVAVSVLPTRTRAAVREAQRGLLAALAELLAAVDDTVRRRDGHDELQAAARALDAALHQALLIARPLRRTWMVAPNPHGLRRLAGFTAVAHHARHLARTVDHETTADRSADGRATLAGAVSRLRELVARAADGGTPAAHEFAAVTDLVVPAGGSADRLAPLAREAGLLAAELRTLLAEPSVAQPSLLSQPSVAQPDEPGRAPSATGRVCGPDHEPVRATVTLVDRTGRQDSRAATGEDGRFTVTPTAAGTYLLVVAPRGDAGRTGSATPYTGHVRLDRDTVLPDVLLRAVPVTAAAPPGPVVRGIRGARTVPEPRSA